MDVYIDADHEYGRIEARLVERSPDPYTRLLSMHILMEYKGCMCLYLHHLYLMTNRKRQQKSNF